MPNWITETLVILIVLMLFLFAVRDGKGAAVPEYSTPDVRDYMTKLMQVDFKHTSCCGPADAYWADEVEECGPGDDAKVGINAYNYTCALVAIVTDTRDDNSFTPARNHVEPGTRVVVPKQKLRNPASENPTDHNIVFLGSNGWVYCWEPVTGI